MRRANGCQPGEQHVRGSPFAELASGAGGTPLLWPSRSLGSASIHSNGGSPSGVMEEAGEGCAASGLTAVSSECSCRTPPCRTPNNSNSISVGGLHRCDSADSLGGFMFEKYQRSPSLVVQEVAGDAVLLAKLATKLLGYLGLGWKWMVALLQLLLFATLLMPGFLQMMVFYFCSSRICRSVRYGEKARNCLDVYVPRYRWLTQQGPRPVVIYVTGGAWTIGYKAWGSLAGRRLSQCGALVFCLDYRNFPQGKATDMMEDVNTGIAWVLEMCEYYGGDPGRVHLVGQSAGAQLVGLAIISQAIRERTGRLDIGSTPPWSPQEIKGFVGVSGAYDLLDLHVHLNKRGMYESLIRAIFTIDGHVSYRKLSPTHVVKHMRVQDWAIMPPIMLLHGSKDKTVPHEISEGFLAAIQASGGDAELHIFDGKTHTSPIVEDPLLGKDMMADYILTMINGEPTTLSVFPMVPKFFGVCCELCQPLLAHRNLPRQVCTRGDND